jgi:N-acetylglutamate synthase-like GNAT family acetyltransferase
MPVIVEYQMGEFDISTDQSRLNIDVIHRFLHDESYWAAGIPRAVVEKSIAHSLCYGIYHRPQAAQVGFSRIITDYATYAYITDVFVLAAYRGRGLAAWLVRCMLEHHELSNLRRWMLFTQDAQTFYQQHGFELSRGPIEPMEKIFPGIYTQNSQ